MYGGNKIPGKRYALPFVGACIFFQPIVCVSFSDAWQVLYRNATSRQNITDFMLSKYGLGLIGGLAITAFIVWYKRKSPSMGGDEPVFYPPFNSEVPLAATRQALRQSPASQPSVANVRLGSSYKPREPQVHAHRAFALTPEYVAQIKDPQEIFHFLNQVYKHKNHTSWLHVRSAQYQINNFYDYLSFRSEVKLSSMDQKSLSTLSGDQKQKICSALLTEIGRLHDIAVQSSSKGVTQALLFRLSELLECHTIVVIKEPMVVLDILNLIYARNHSWLIYKSTSGGVMQAGNFYEYLAGKMKIILGVIDTREALKKVIAGSANKQSVCDALDAAIASLDDIAKHSSDGQKAQNLLSRLKDLLYPAKET